MVGCSLGTTRSRCRHLCLLLGAAHPVLLLYNGRSDGVQMVHEAENTAELVLGSSHPGAEVASSSAAPLAIAFPQPTVSSPGLLSWRLL